jgi:hypothetical protein
MAGLHMSLHQGLAIFRAFEDVFGIAHRRQSWGLGVVTPHILVMEGVVSGLLRSKGEGKGTQDPQFSNQFDVTDILD